MSSCNWGRMTLAAVAFAVVGWLGGWLVWEHLFQAAAQAHAGLWRPAGSMEMTLYPVLGSLLAGFAVACLYSKCCGECERSLEKDLQFGITLWLIVVGVCSLAFYGYSPVSVELLWACIIHKAILFVGGTLAISWIMCGKVGSCGMKS